MARIPFGGKKKKSYDKDFQYILRIHGTSLLHSLLDHLTVRHLVISCNMFTYKMLSFLVLDKQNVNVYPFVLKLKGEVFDYRHQIILFLRNQDVLFYNKSIFLFFIFGNMTPQPVGGTQPWCLSFVFYEMKAVLLILCPTNDVFRFPSVGSVFLNCRFSIYEKKTSTY